MARGNDTAHSDHTSRLMIPQASVGQDFMVSAPCSKADQAKSKHVHALHVPPISDNKTIQIVNDVAEGHATLINQQAIKDKYIYKTCKLVESGLHAYASLVRSIF